jgi:hypothetical protein
MAAIQSRVHAPAHQYNDAQIRALNNFNGSEEKLVSGDDPLMNFSPSEDLCKGHCLLLA